MNSQRIVIIFLIIFTINFTTIIAKKTRKCSCKEQNKCIESFKDYAPPCYKLCQEKFDIQKVAGKKVNEASLQKCVDLWVQLFSHTLDCAYGGDLQKKSCAKDNKGSEIEEVDSVNFFTEEVKQAISESNGAASLNLEKGSATNTTVSAEAVSRFVSIRLCARECMTAKQLEGRCHAKNKCELDLEKQLVKDVLHKCYHSDVFKKDFKAICGCYLEAGISGLQSFCDSL